MDPSGDIRATRPGGCRVFVQQVVDVVLAHRLVTAGPDRVEQQRSRLWCADVERVEVLVKVTAGLVHDRDRPGLVALASQDDPAVPAGGVEVGEGQVEDFLDPGGGVEQ